MLGYSERKRICLHRSARERIAVRLRPGPRRPVGPTAAVSHRPTERSTAASCAACACSSEAKHRVADDASGALYVAQAAVGVWRYNADPEAESGFRSSSTSTACGPYRRREVGGSRIVNGGQGADYPGRRQHGRRCSTSTSAAASVLQPHGQSDREPSALFGLRAPVGLGLPAGGLLIADDRKWRASSSSTSPSP
ncbi:hypothetical protein ACRAWD_20045 [Caulobacter segnis]